MARKLLWWDSSEENTNAAAGSNNNINTVVVAEPVKIEHDWIVYLLSIITIIKLLEMAYLIYRGHQRRLKKRYTNYAINASLAPTSCPPPPQQGHPNQGTR